MLLSSEVVSVSSGHSGIVIRTMWCMLGYPWAFGSLEILGSICSSSGKGIVLKFQ